MIFSYYRKGKKNDPKMQLEARLGWKSDWRRSQIGTEARLAQRPDCCGGQIGVVACLARLAEMPDWLGGLLIQ